LWFLIAPLLGVLQAFGSFIWLFARDAQPAVWEAGLVHWSSLWSAWLLPTLLIVDVALLRRTLPGVDLGKFLAIISVAAGVISLLSPGMLVMIGCPVTAATIILVAIFLHHHSKNRSLQN
jgi:hypothetical protein